MQRDVTPTRLMCCRKRLDVQRHRPLRLMHIFECITRLAETASMHARNVETAGVWRSGMPTTRRKGAACGTLRGCMLDTFDPVYSGVELCLSVRVLHATLIQS